MWLTNGCFAGAVFSRKMPTVPISFIIVRNCTKFAWDAGFLGTDKQPGSLRIDSAGGAPAAATIVPLGA